MTTRSISTLHRDSVCDVCGRTLLRGEHTEAFLSGGRRFEVCELCKPHALHEGWVREGTVPDYQATGAAPRRRGSLMGRLRARRTGENRGAGKRRRGPQSLDDELGGGAFNPQAAPEELDDYQDEVPDLALEQPQQPPAAPVPPRRPSRRAPQPRSQPQRDQQERSAQQPQPARQPRQRPGRRAAPPAPQQTEAPLSGPREPRHVHAIPTDDGHKAAAAVAAFNGSEYCRTIAGVSRSLGAPAVNVTADENRAGSVWIVTSWELCWYRYEVDISEPRPAVRLDSQGYELAELTDAQRFPNAAADGGGQIALV